MNGFTEAMVSREKSILIPYEYDYWKDAIDSWKLDLYTQQTEHKFHWQNESTLKDGTVKIWCEAFATGM